MRIVRNEKKLSFVLIIFTVLIFASLAFIVLRREGLANMQISTDGVEYENGGVSKLKIKNISQKTICFSSCYPYLLQRKDLIWKTYNYKDCPDSDIIKTCLAGGETKAFETELPQVKEGLHRFVVPVCEDCKTKESFRETRRFYSNEFKIN